MRTVVWDPEGPRIDLIDQRLLPVELRILSLYTPEEVAEAIRTMVVRGAPAIGVTAGFGMALAAARSSATDPDGLRTDLIQANELLRAARPTAVNLAWALDRLMKTASEALKEGTRETRRQILAEAQRMADEDVEINQQIGRFGAELIPDVATVIHHCNTGSLATVDYGTALGVIRTAHESGKRVHVLVDETRPRLQGARLTAWELEQYGMSYDIISDNAAGHFLRSGEVDAVFVGADRVAANGDIANKIGTYMLALAAHDNEIPFYCAVPTSTVDLDLPTGDQIPIELRDASEVLDLERNGKRLSPEGAQARNPAFDITPHRLVTAMITEVGVLSPPFSASLRQAVEQVRKP